MHDPDVFVLMHFRKTDTFFSKQPVRWYNTRLLWKKHRLKAAADCHAGAKNTAAICDNADGV